MYSILNLLSSIGWPYYKCEHEGVLVLEKHTSRTIDLTRFLKKSPKEEDNSNSNFYNFGSSCDVQLGF